MLQFGIYLSATNSLWNLAREGARVASIKASTSTTANQEIIDAIYARTPPNLDTKQMTIVITPTDSSTRTSKSKVTVSITYDMTKKLFVPLPKELFGRDLGKAYRTEAAMMVE